MVPATSRAPVQQPGEVPVASHSGLKLREQGLSFQRGEA